MNQNLKLSTPSNLQTEKFASDISLFDIIDFLKESWKPILTFTIFGISLAALYLLVTPKQYEAIALIKMGQIETFINNNSSVSNIEQPQTTITRMSFPTSYSKETIALCGLANEENADALLVEKVEFSIPKGLVDIVKLKVRSTSKEIARECSNTIFQLIKLAQDQSLDQYININNKEITKKMAFDADLLDQMAQIISKLSTSGGADSAKYLATYNQIYFMLNQISKLQDKVITRRFVSTQLAAPIYVNNNPVFPQKPFKILVLGLLLGCLMGILLALVQKAYQFIRLNQKC